MFSFAVPRPRPRISLTPMIDVVFLLLVFFMLVARFGQDQVIPVSLAGGGGAWTGPPRLVAIAPNALRLNGVEMEMRPLLLELVRLTETGSDPVILQPMDDATLGRVVEVMEILGQAGFENLAFVENGQ